MIPKEEVAPVFEVVPRGTIAAERVEDRAYVFLDGIDVPVWAWSNTAEVMFVPSANPVSADVAHHHSFKFLILRSFTSCS